MAPLSVKIHGDWACFTRPEAKVERLSYSVMTASAARGVLESIFWKPEFDWRIRAIDVLKPIMFAPILRNEVTEKASPRREYLIATEVRAQRHALILRDVAYMIHADIVPHAGVKNNEAAYRDQFRRRVERGQAYRAPYLGCREFACYFEPPKGDESPIDETAELGWMLFDLAYDDDKSGRGQPIFFQAELAMGRLAIPDSLYQQAA